MPQGFPDLKKLIIQLSPKFCENCGNKYAENDLHIVQKVDTGFIAHLRCSKCGNTYIMNILNTNGTGIIGANRMPFNTDLSIEELEFFFKQKEGISTDDILATYNYLKSDILKEDIAKKIKLEKEKREKKIS